MDSPPHRTARWAWWLMVTAGPGLLVLGFFTVPLGVFGPKHPAFSWTVLGLTLAVLAVLLLRQIRLILQESERGLPGLAILLLSSLALMVFAGTYLALSRQPGEFKGLSTRVDALYFTVVTLSTVGYGDITAAGQAARVVVVVQILYTFVFLAAGATALSQRVRGRLGHRSPPGTGGPEAPGGPAPDQPTTG